MMITTVRYGSIKLHTIISYFFFKYPGTTVLCKKVQGTIVLFQVYVTGTYGTYVPLPVGTMYRSDIFVHSYGTVPYLFLHQKSSSKDKMQTNF